jgi:1,4-alpha-glucan branching enzyme
MLPLSHDEVVHGKSPMLYKMPGDEWQKFANLRLLYLYMFTHPGAKLLFMGNEFGQTSEWNYKSELDWPLLKFDAHKKLQECVRELCGLYRGEPALYQKQFEMGGFEWIDLNHREESVITFRRKGNNPEEEILVILNMTPEVRNDWTVEVKGKASWKEIFNTDDKKFWGTGNVFNPEPVITVKDEKEMIYEIKVHLPPLGGIVLK